MQTRDNSPALYVIWDSSTWFWLVLRSQGKFQIVSSFCPDDLDGTELVIVPLLNAVRILFGLRLRVLSIDLYHPLRRIYADLLEGENPGGIEVVSESSVLEWLLENRADILDLAEDRTHEYQGEQDGNG